MYSDTHTLLPDFACGDSGRSSFADTPPVFNEQEMILRYLPLVQRVVAKIKRRVPAHIDADDLHSMGVAGLIAAVRKFNPATERTFARFAGIRIQGAILDGLRRTDSCSRRSRLLARKLDATAGALEQSLGRAPTSDEICRALGCSREAYERMVESARPIRIVALDGELGDGEGNKSSMHGLLADPNDETGSERMEKAELLKLLGQRIAELPEMPRKIVAMYYFENMRFSEIAEAFNLTESRISQIHRSTVEGLRKWIRVARQS
jgi:RNA polymerase sigma factor for flagellar operon FliA